jgi:fucose permease
VTSPLPPPVTVQGLVPARVVTARNAVAVTFGLNGLALASWFSRIPAAREALDLQAGTLGLLLLAMSSGAVLALTSAGAITHRWGPARTAAAGTALLAVGLVIVGSGSGILGSVPVAAIGLFAVGYGSGTCDVAINVEGAAVERQLGRTVMPRFHAAWSIGTVTGAGLGAVSSHTGLPIAAHLGFIAALNLVGTLIAIRWYLPAEPSATTEASGAVPEPGSARTPRTAESPDRERAAGGKSGSSGALDAWLEPRTLLIGLLVLSVAFTEGTANDWLAVAFVDGYRVSEAAGAMVFGVFVAAMTTGRTFGTIALDRWGRVRVLLGTMMLAAAGTGLAVLAGSIPLALVGVALWGLGASLGFPVGMSAAADDETRAAARVSVVATMGYTAFLAGPPLVGFLGNHVGVLRALLVVPVLLLPALALVPAARPPAAKPVVEPVAELVEPVAEPPSG